MTIRTITVSGVTAVNFNSDGKRPYFYASEKYVWVKNNSDAAMYVSLDENCVTGAAGTALISSGECGRIELSPENTLYISGSGSAEIRTGDTAECPFKVQTGGGDLTNYYTRTEADNKFAAKSDIDFNYAPTAAEINTAINDIWGV